MAERLNLSCAFNATVYGDTLEQVPELVKWAEDHIDLVHVMVFIAYREAVLSGQFDYYQGGHKVDPNPLVYAAPEAKHRGDISSPEVVATIQRRFPDFAPAAYLGGTEKPDSLKWLMAGRIGTPGNILGYVGPKVMEATQTLHHLATGRYFAYASPRLLRLGRPMLAAGAIDPGTRSALGSYLRWLGENPLRAARPLHFQSIMFIQPIDILEDGRQNMCDACPDITVHDGQLVWSCRLEEQLNYGSFLRTVPRRKNGAARSLPVTTE
jgi:hypothetical protein